MSFIKNIARLVTIEIIAGKNMSELTMRDNRLQIKSNIIDKLILIAPF